MNIIHHSLELIRLLVNFDLAISACSVFEHFGNVIDRMAASEMVYYIINEIEQFIDQYPGVHFFFFTKIDQSSINPISAGSPFIFIDQGAGVLNEIEVFGTQLIDLRTNCLEKAAMAIVSCTVIGTSQMRNSTVLKNGCTRRSHQIFFALSMQLVFTSSLT